MSEALPEGWAEAPFSTLITELRNGISTRPALEPPGTPILRISATRPGVVALDDRRFLPKGEALLGAYGLRDRDLLFTRYNGSIELLGVCGMVRGLGDTQLLYPDKLMRVRVRADLVSPEYVELFFRSPPARDAIMGLAKSSAGQQGISGGDLKEQTVAVAPLPEQRRIVTQVEALLEQVNRAKGRLDRVPLILKRFRQAVLAAAFSGELTPGLDSEAWEKTLLGAVIDGFEAGRNLKSQGRSAGPGEFGVLKISAVTWGNFRPDENKALLPGDEPRPRERIRAGDVLITRANTYDLVGAVVLVANDHPNLMLPDKILRLRLKTGLVDGRFLVHALRSKEVRDHFESEATGTSDSMRNLSQPKMEAAPLILPPLNEQALVADAIGRLLTLADTIERRVQVATSRADKLPQAILSKAFSGELVPTEADLARAEGRTYETAAELLERARHELENGGTKDTSALRPAPKGKRSNGRGGGHRLAGAPKQSSRLPQQDPRDR